MLHAVEKPMNLDYAKPFSNTSDLKNMTPKIHPELAQKKQEQEREAQHKSFIKNKFGFTQDPEIELDEDQPKEKKPSR